MEVRSASTLVSVLLRSDRVRQAATGLRRIVFVGAHNFRDLGGYPTVRGGRTRWGTVYRADGLQELTAADIVRYEALGIRSMFDLRRDQEREERPNRVPSVPLCIMKPVDQSGVVDPAPTYCDTRVSGEESLLSVYRSMLWNSASVLGTVIGRIVAPGGTPVGFHCHAGKDRTGFVAAILLEAVGVDRNVVLDDYELTATYQRPARHTDSFERLVARGMAAEAALGMMGAPRWAMAETLAELDATFGGARRYLTDRGGVDDNTLQLLEETLVE